MRAVVLRRSDLVVTDVAEPVPGAGQLLLASRACGICGTDLHARHHLQGFLDGQARSGTPMPVDATADVVFGHEFCGEVLERGPDTSTRIRTGTLVVGLPYVTGAFGPEYIGYSNRFPGGFAERMVVTEKLMFAVPEEIAPEVAALTEPFAVGAHAVARAAVPDGAVVLVVGCGPIGLAVIAALKARGLGPVVGIDFSAGRRRFAEALGADEVVDAATETQAQVWARMRPSRTTPAVVFECVGRPGVAQAIIDEVPKNARVVVVGNVLGNSAIDQVVAFNKELDIRFAANYTRDEFGQTLDDLVATRIDGTIVLTGMFGADEVPDAFEALAHPEGHAKVMVTFD